MTASASPEPSADREPVWGAITSRGEFHRALQAALSHVAKVGCRHLWWCDADFADWPLNDPALIVSLSAWAQSHRRLTLMATSFETFARRHPRWVTWRQPWSHIVTCRVLEEIEPGTCPTLLLAPDVLVLRLADPLHHRGTVSADLADTVRAREEIDALSQRSAEAFPATTLGL
jgi:hypothetical protein